MLPSSVPRHTWDRAVQDWGPAASGVEVGGGGGFPALWFLMLILRPDAQRAFSSHHTQVQKPHFYYPSKNNSEEALSSAGGTGNGSPEGKKRGKLSVSRSHFVLLCAVYEAQRRLRTKTQSQRGTGVCFKRLPVSLETCRFHFFPAGLLSQCPLNAVCSVVT